MVLVVVVVYMCVCVCWGCGGGVVVVGGGRPAAKWVLGGAFSQVLPFGRAPRLRDLPCALHA